MARYTKYSKEELIAFIERADTEEKIQIAWDFLGKLKIPEEWEDQLNGMLLAQGEWITDHGNNPFYEDPRWDMDDRGRYSPSAPWNAPGMRVSDFI